VRVTVRENVAAGPWIIALAGLASSNMPLTIIADPDLGGTSQLGHQ